jgi:exopolysaccharide production protein ExoZ
MSPAVKEHTFINSVTARLTALYEMSSSSARVPAMEGIRGAAVTLVFFVHYFQLFAKPMADCATRRILSWAGAAGFSGVDLFFLLSGYLIYSVVRAEKRSLTHFFVRRGKRIYPTFLIVLFLYLVVLLLTEQEKLPHETGAAVIYLLQNVLLLPGLFSIPPLITVAWSLSYEIFYYAALPAVYRLFRMKRWSNPLARSGFFFGLAAIYFWCCVRWPDVAIPRLSLQPFQHIRLTMFVSGILCYEALASPAVKKWIGGRFEVVATAAGLGAVVAIPAMEERVPAYIQAAMLFFAYGLLMICCLGRPQGRLARTFSWTPLRWLGNMSYSYYLIHAFVLHGCVAVLARLIRPWRTESVIWAALPFCFLATWAGASILFALVEKPLSFSKRRGESLAVRTVIVG